MIKPARLTLNRDALVILGMIGGVVATELLAEVFEFARYGDQPGAFVSAALAAPLRATLSPDVLEAGFAILWWAHIVLVAAFLCYLPFSKHLHIATSFPNIWFRKLAPRGELPKLDIEDETATFGLKTLQDLGWKDLLDGFTCTECGRCEAACPAHATGKPLDPKLFIMGIREMSVDAEHGLDLIPNSPIVRETYGLDDTTPSAAALAQPIVDTAIPYDAVWDCVTCGACVEACPVLIEHVDKIVGLRRNLVLEESRFPQELTPAFRAMEGQGNPWGQPASARLDWTRPLTFPVRTVADGPGRRGGSTSSRSSTGSAARRRSTRATRRSPGPSRPACTPPASRSRSSARRSRARATRPAGWATTTSSRSSRPRRVDTLQRYGMGERTIVTACPHCFNTIANEYGQLGGTFRVVHHSTYLASLVASGRLATAARGRRLVDRRPSAGQRDRPRLVLPGPLQRRGRRRRGTCSGAAGVAVTEMEQQRQDHVLLRRRRRSDVDGGDARHADQRRADPPGPRDGRRDGRHGLPVLHGHAVGRPGRGRRRDDGQRHGHQRGPRRHGSRPCRTTGACRWCRAGTAWRPGSSPVWRGRCPARFRSHRSTGGFGRDTGPRAATSPAPTSVVALDPGTHLGRSGLRRHGCPSGQLDAPSVGARDGP